MWCNFAIHHKRSYICWISNVMWWIYFEIEHHRTKWNEMEVFHDKTFNFKLVPKLVVNNLILLHRSLDEVKYSVVQLRGLRDIVTLQKYVNNNNLFMITMYHVQWKLFHFSLSWVSRKKLCCLQWDSAIRQDTLYYYVTSPVTKRKYITNVPTQDCVLVILLKTF